MTGQIFLATLSTFGGIIIAGVSWIFPFVALADRSPGKEVAIVMSIAIGGITLGIWLFASGITRIMGLF